MSYREELQQFKRNYWMDLLARCEQNIHAAARASGMHRCHIYKVLESLGIHFEKAKNGHRGNWGDLTN